MKKMLLVLGIVVLGVTAARADVVISVGRAFTFACGGAGVYCDVAPAPPPPLPRGDGVVVIVGGGSAPHRAAPPPRGRVARHDVASHGGGKGGAPHGGRR